MKRSRVSVLFLLLALTACGGRDQAWYQAHPDQARQKMAACQKNPDPECVMAEAALKALFDAETAARQARMAASRAKWLAMIDQYDGMPLVEIEKQVANCSPAPIADLDYENGCTAVREAIKRARNRRFDEEVARYKALPAGERFKLLRPKGALCRMSRGDPGCEALRIAEEQLTGALVKDYRTHPALRKQVYDKCAAEWAAAHPQRNAVANPFADWTQCMAAKRATGLSGVDRLAY